MSPLLVAGEVLAPACGLAVGSGGPDRLRRTLEVQHVLPAPRAVDPVGLLPFAGRAAPLGQQDPDETLPSAGAGADPHGDLLEALRAALLDLDQPTQGSDDGRREVVAGEFLSPLEQR